MKSLLTKTLLLLVALNSFAQPKSKIVTIDKFKSEFVEPHNVEIWLPAEYAADPKKKFPVLYMQDGQNVFNPKTSMSNIAWEADDTAAKLIAANQIEPVIIVAIWSNSDTRYIEYLPEKALAGLSQKDMAEVDKIKKQAKTKETELLGDEYLKFLTQELKPYIDGKYRTMPDAAHTSICGSSMGGLISLYAICEYPDVFGKAACVSTHWPMVFDSHNMNFSTAMKQYLFEKLPAPKNHGIYFDYGTATLDKDYEVHQKAVDNIMKMKGFEFQKNWLTRKYENAPHNEKAWQERFDQVLLFLYRTNKQPQKKH
jgi:predicted alpha/beta superfamily hydrolase